ncbi:Uncharacterized protein ABJ98_1549 [Pseudomonas syringae pv. aceris]|nr:Uncharacterized protein ABJ98_1549 [Pseudomonas syringae pv. aceris]
MAQDRLHIIADALGIDVRDRQYIEAEAVTQIIDVQGQRVVGAFFAAQGIDTLPRLHGLFGHAGRGAVPVVEQGAEQRGRCGYAAATLGQGEGCVLMAEQFGQAFVGRSDPGAHALFVHDNPQWQSVDEHPQCPFRALAAQHTAHQYGAEHHILLARYPAQHLSPGQVMQAGGTHPQLSGTGAQTQAQRRRQHTGGLFDRLTVALHIAYAKRQRRFIDIAEHVVKERLLLLAAHTQAGLGHVVAIRYGRAEGVGLVEQIRLNLMAHHLQRSVVQRHVMEAQHYHPALAGFVFGKHQLHQWRPGQIKARVTNVEALSQLACDIAVARVRMDLFHTQLGLAPDHLQRLVQPLPDHRRAQDVMAVDDLLQRVGKGFQTLTIRQCEL